MVENHVDIYKDAIFIDGREVLVVKDSISIQEPVNGEILSISLEVFPATLTMHRTEKPESSSGQDEVDQDAPTVGTAYIDVKPRFDFSQLSEDDFRDLVDKVNKKVTDAMGVIPHKLAFTQDEVLDLLSNVAAGDVDLATRPTTH